MLIQYTISIILYIAIYIFLERIMGGIDNRVLRERLDFLIGVIVIAIHNKIITSCEYQYIHPENHPEDTYDLTHTLVPIERLILSDEETIKYIILEIILTIAMGLLQIYVSKYHDNYFEFVERQNNSIVVIYSLMSLSCFCFSVGEITTEAMITLIGECLVIVFMTSIVYKVQCNILSE